MTRKTANLAIALLAISAVQAAPLPTPEQFAGFRMGADTKLVRWDRIVEYMGMAASASPRVKVEELGKTTTAIHSSRSPSGRPRQ